MNNILLNLTRIPLSIECHYKGVMLENASC